MKTVKTYKLPQKVIAKIELHRKKENRNQANMVEQMVMAYKAV